MKRIFVVAAVAASLLAAPAMAGDHTMTGPDGTIVKIACKGSGCKVRAKAPNGKWSTVHKGPGGTANYEKIVADYSAKGFK